MIPTQAYWYNYQLKKYIVEFLAIFSGLQVHIGRNDNAGSGGSDAYIPVTIHYGNHDRTVASLMADNTQNKPLRLPMMTAYMHSLTLALELMHGTGVERRNSYVPMGGLLPDDVQVVHQRMPVIYKMGIELGIYASNTDQHFQILEQILMLFDPQLMIQISDAPFDFTRLTSVKLVDVRMDQPYPVGTDRRIIQSTLMFEAPVYLSSPADIRKDYIKRILMRIGAVDTALTESADIVDALDALGIQYEETANAANLGVV